MSKLQYLIKKATENFQLDRNFLRAPAPFRMSEKISFLARKYHAIATDLRQITYFNHDFHFDNRLMPALLQTYSEELLHLDKYVNFSQLLTVFDVGANIGQFASTASGLFPHLKLYSFEPNSAIFPLLRQNSQSHNNWRVFDFGLADIDCNRDLFYVAGKSAQGSIYKENSSLGLLSDAPLATSVKLVKLDAHRLQQLNLPRNIDLLKIDVEGFEVEVLKSLPDLEWKYLYIEISTKRTGSQTVEGIQEFIAKIWTIDAELLWLSDEEPFTRHALFHWPKTKTA